MKDIKRKAQKMHAHVLGLADNLGPQEKRRILTALFSGYQKEIERTSAKLGYPVKVFFEPVKEEVTKDEKVDNFGDTRTVAD